MALLERKGRGCSGQKKKGGRRLRAVEKERGARRKQFRKRRNFLADCVKEPRGKKLEQGKGSVLPIIAGREEKGRGPSFPWLEKSKVYRRGK